MRQFKHGEPVTAYTLIEEEEPAELEEACAACGGTGWRAAGYTRQEDHVESRATPCPACARGQGILAARQARLFGLAALPEEYQGRDFDSWRAMPGADIPAAAAVETYATARHPKHGLYLWGGVGTGKTGLAWCVAKWWTVRDGIVPLFRGTGALWERVRAAYGQGDGPSVDALVTELAECPRLILDDLGSERRTEFVAELLTRILDQRADYGRPTLITSNLGLGDLEAWLDQGGGLAGQRVVSRIKKLTDHGRGVIQVGGVDQR